MRGFDLIEPGVFRDPRSGKIYTSVSYRTGKFREKYPEWGVDFLEVPYEGGNGVTKDDPRGRFIKMRCEIRDKSGRLVAVGHAEEDRKFGPDNKTSAIENAETSALGRALANLGFLTDQYASAEEVEQAQARERAMKRYEKGDHVENHREGNYRAQGVVEKRPRPEEEEKPTPKPSGDDSPYSPLFRHLLVEIGAANDKDTLLAIKNEITKNKDDLKDSEVEELRTQFLARRASLKGGKNHG